jgi:EmrB/QacA subfamily drug resistance transporter
MQESNTERQTEQIDGMIQPSPQPGMVTLSRKQFVGTIAGLQLILLLAALDQTIITTAMPRIISELGGFNRYAWATTSYLLTSTLAVPIFGRLSDTYGRKPLLIIGVLTFIVGSVLCGLAGADIPVNGMTQLIAARAIQGTGGGIMLGLIFTTIADILAPADRGRYQGHFAAMFALASIVGPTLGGWVSDQFTWRWLFFINVPLGAMALSVFCASFPKVVHRRQPVKLDVLGIVVFSAFLVPMLIGLGWVAEFGYQSAPALVALIFSAVMACTFIFIELRAEQPLMPVFLFLQPLIAISSISLFVTGIGLFGSILLIPLFLQAVVGVTAATSGALLTPLILAVAAASVVGGLSISHTKRYKSLVLFSLLLMCVGVFSLSRISATSPLTLIMSYMLVVGAGMGLLLPVYTIIIQNAVPQDKLGTVTGFSQFFRSIGGTIGVAAFGSLMLASYRHHLRTMLPPNFPAKAYALLESPLEPNKLKAQLAVALAPYHSLSSSAILDDVRHALVSSIDHVFTLYTGALAITLVITLWLEDRPLRSKVDLDQSH